MRFFSILLFAILAAGCDSSVEEFGNSDVTAVLVANQGNFSDGNGSVMAYNPDSKAVNPSVASGLGSIVQSLHLDARGQLLYVLANSANRIDIYDLTSLARVGQITGVLAPRYMAQVGSRLYVTNLYGAQNALTGGKVTVIDGNTFTRLGEIEVGQNPEGIVAVGNRLFVANHGFGAGRTVSVIERATAEVVQTLDVECDGPRFVLADLEEDVWVFCTGQTLYDDSFNVVGQTPGAVRVLDGSTGQIKERFAVSGRIGAEGGGQDAFFHPGGREVFAVKDSRTVLRFRTDTNAFADSFRVTGDPIGAIGFDTLKDRVYLGRVSGYTTNGEVTIHERGGQVSGRFEAGIAPSFITFLHFIGF